MNKSYRSFQAVFLTWAREAEAGESFKVTF